MRLLRGLPWSFAIYRWGLHGVTGQGFPENASYRFWRRLLEKPPLNLVVRCLILQRKWAFSITGYGSALATAW